VPVFVFNYLLVSDENARQQQQQSFDLEDAAKTTLLEQLHICLSR